jgi:membrane protein DedA with SNARE-associated domain
VSGDRRSDPNERESVMSAALLTQFLALYGYFAVAVFVGLESLGIPLPGESILIAAALYAGSTHRLNIVAVAAVAAVAAVVGDNIGYAIGRRGGMRLLKRYGHYVRLTEPRLTVGLYLFQRHGGKVVFFGRFVSVLRTYAAFLAGASRMSWRRFVVANTAGGVIWAAVCAIGAYALGSAATGLGTMSTFIGIGLTLLLSIVIAVLVHRSMPKWESRARAGESVL